MLLYLALQAAAVPVLVSLLLIILGWEDLA